MPTVTAFEAKTRFGELLDRASRGEEIVITRHDKPVARLVPEGGAPHREIAAAARELKGLSASIDLKKAPVITKAAIRKAINEGRR